MAALFWRAIIITGYLAIAVALRMWSAGVRGMSTCDRQKCRLLSALTVERLNEGLRKMISEQQLQDQGPKKNTTRAYRHSTDVRDKISRANKGKLPWNVGIAHSDETKFKIALAVRAARDRRLQERANTMGITLTEVKARSNRTTDRDQKMTFSPKFAPRVVSEEARIRASERMRQRWQIPEYRLIYMNRTREVSVETRTRISDSLKRYWSNRPTNLPSKPLSEEVRRKISAALKDKWTNAAYRAKMSEIRAASPRGESWRATVAQAIRAKWQDPDYRANVRRGHLARRAKALYATEEARPTPACPRMAAQGAEGRLSVPEPEFSVASDDANPAPSIVKRAPRSRNLPTANKPKAKKKSPGRRRDFALEDSDAESESRDGDDEELPYDNPDDDFIVVYGPGEEVHVYSMAEYEHMRAAGLV